MDTQDLMDILTNIKRYDASIGGGCSCCGSWVELEEDPIGDLVEFEDIEDQIKTLVFIINEERNK